MLSPIHMMYLFVNASDLNTIFQHQVLSNIFNDSGRLSAALIKEKHRDKKPLTVDSSSVCQFYKRFQISAIILDYKGENSADILSKVYNALLTILRIGYDNTAVFQWIIHTKEEKKTES